MNYSPTFASITNGKGVLSLQFGGYDRCHNPEQVIGEIGYVKNADPAYTSSSIFCAKGKGYSVPWMKRKLRCIVCEMKLGLLKECMLNPSSCLIKLNYFWQCQLCTFFHIYFMVIETNEILKRLIVTEKDWGEYIDVRTFTNRENIRRVP